ncbi:hypothetical protein N9966_00820 [bacterium]|nr:hypothetical protein [bacterium]
MTKINKSNSSNGGIDFTKAKDVIGALVGLFKVPSLPAPPVSKRTALSSVLRSGLSPSKIAGEIIKRQSEAGAVIGANDDGSENIAEKMERIRVEEIVSAIISDCRVTIINLPGQKITASGVTPPGGGPVQVVGTSLTTSNGYGVLS